MRASFVSMLCRIHLSSLPCCNAVFTVALLVDFVGSILSAILLGVFGGVAVFIVLGALTWIWIRSGAGNSSSECDDRTMLVTSFGFCTLTFGLVVLARRTERGTCLQLSSLASLGDKFVNFFDGTVHLR